MQQYPLLQTKLHIPRMRPDLVSRPRLVERLSAGLPARSGFPCALTLVSAPAGFGKTTLLSEWATGYQGRVAWLSLDKEDNDEVRFWTYLIAALQTVQADLGREALGLLLAPQRAPTQAILTALLNEVVTLPKAMIAVLDDYHLISDPAIHEGMAFLLEHLPPQMHLAIATRADPPLPVHRLRACGQLTELRSGDLRFTADEAAAFLNAAMGLNLATEDVEALEARTEGWIVGLQLAALSLQGRSDAHEFIAAFSGGHHYVLEYLIEEVVRSQPKPVQRFLVQTSILDRLCAPLCNAVTGGDDGEAMLERLRQRNLFIVPLDSEHYWVRYHHLFADLLGNLLRKASPAESIRELHLRACQWYRQNGLAAEAVNHALAAQDFERTAQLIEEHSLAMVTRGEMTTLLRWIKALPEEVAHSRPWLCVHQAWPLTLAGKADAAEPLLQQIERQVSTEDLDVGGKEVLGNVAAMRAMMALMHGEMPRAVELAHRADGLLPPDNLIPRHTIPFVLAAAHSGEGDLVKATQSLVEELQLGRESGNLWTVVRSLCDLADLHIMQGRLRKAEELCQEALQQAEERRARQFGTVGYALVKLGEICYARNDLVAAREYAIDGINLMQGWLQPFEMVSGHTTLAAILQALGDANGALEALHNAEAILAQHPSYPRLNSLVQCRRIEMCLALDGPEEAARQAIAAGLGTSRMPMLREQEEMVLARVLVAQHRWDEALHLLARLADQTEAGGRFGRLIEILALQAVVWQVQGERAGALGALEKALAMGEPEGYGRAFVQQGAPLATLLRHAAARGIASQYVGELLAASGEEEAKVIPAPAPAGSAALAEPLTPRELEVLHLLGEGCSNREIAEALVITLNGVKKHTSNIYGKLGVHSRTQAVVRAQEVGLL